MQCNRSAHAAWGRCVFVGNLIRNLTLHLRVTIYMKRLRSSDCLNTSPFLTRELRACARASYRYDVGNGIRSLARSLARLVDSCKLFLDFRLLSAFYSFWRAINRRNGDLCY